MKQRVRAFTIMELTIAMLLAAIVIGITYTCYTIIYKSYTGFKARQTELVEISQLNQLMNRDFEAAEIVLQQGEETVLKLQNREIKYHIQPDYIVRLSSTVDTFKVNTTDLEPLFEHRPLNSPAAGDEQPRIDELRFMLILGNDKYPRAYCKQYSAENLINRNPNANN